MPKYKLRWREWKEAIVEADSEDDACGQIDTAEEIEDVIKIED